MFREKKIKKKYFLFAGIAGNLCLIMIITAVSVIYYSLEIIQLGTNF